MSVTKILIVEDEPNMVAGLRDNFEYEGFQVTTALDGVDGLERALKDSPDLVILDVMMPRLSGLDVCKQLKAKRPSIPIIMLTARGQEVDKVVGLELGADDYVTKPFSMREVVARVRALLRRNEQAGPQKSKLQRGDIMIDPMAHSVMVSGRTVELSALEFRLLHYLASHPGMVFSRDQLLDSVWGNDRTVTPRSVDVYIRRVREKIENQPQQPIYVQTVHGVGYRFALNGDE